MPSGFYVGESITCTPIEYAECSGTQYVETDIVAYKTKMEMKIQVPNTSKITANGYFGGEWYQNNNRYYVLQAQLSGSSRYFRVCDRNNTQTTIQSMDTNVHTIIYNNENNKVLWDGVEKATVSDLTEKGTANIYLFSRGKTDEMLTSGRIYYAKITDKETSTLVADLIPVRLPNGEVCFYDNVTHKLFKNKGVGSLTGGNPTGDPDITITNVAREITHAYVGTPAYYPVEYIESSGTQWIDSGITPNQNFGFELDFVPMNAPTSSGAQAYINAGGAGGNVGVNLRVAINVFTATATPNGELQLGDVKIDNGLTRNVRQTISLKNKVATFPDGTTHIMTTADFTSPNTLTIFGAHMSGGTVERLASAKIYSLKLYNGDTLTRDFVPAYANGQYCLYDKVENKAYYNAGTGNFTAGPRTSAESFGIARKIRKAYVGVNNLARLCYKLLPYGYVSSADSGINRTYVGTDNGVTK